MYLVLKSDKPCQKVRFIEIYLEIHGDTPNYTCLSLAVTADVNIRFDLYALDMGYAALVPLKCISEGGTLLIFKIISEGGYFLLICLTEKNSFPLLSFINGLDYNTEAEANHCIIKKSENAKKKKNNEVNFFR